MTTCVIDVNEVNGDVREHYHLCSATCQYQALVTIANSATETQWHGLVPEYGAGEQTAGNGQTIEYGAWPGGCETDSDEWCAFCGAFLWHGLECECPDREAERLPLPDYGELVASYDSRMLRR